MREYAEPYRQQTSIAYQAFQACKKGIKEKDLIKLVEQMHGKPERVLKSIKRGFTRRRSQAWQWDVDEKNGWVKVLNVRAVKEKDSGKRRR